MTPIGEAVDTASARKLDVSHLRAFRAAGKAGLLGYLGPQAWKSLTPLIVGNARTLGLSLGFIWEDNPTYPGWFTAEKGALEAATATLKAKALSVPPGRALYLTVDFDAQPKDKPAILEYVAAAKRTMSTYKLGMYAPYVALMWMLEQPETTPDYLYQPYAWARGKVLDGIHLYQYQNGQHIGGVTVDLDHVLKDPGWWAPPGVIKTKESGKVANEPELREGSTGAAVQVLQKELNQHGAKPQLAMDGDFGPKTLAAVKAFQFRAFGSKGVDGIVGPQTWGALDKPVEVRPHQPKPVVPGMTRKVLATFKGDVLNDALYFTLQGPDGTPAAGHICLDTGSFEILLPAYIAQASKLPNLGALQIGGVGGHAASYRSKVSFVMGKPWTDVDCVIDPGWNAPFDGLFGAKWFIDNRLDLEINWATGEVTIYEEVAA